jgi:UDP-N-acetylglucosamine--N-acetylmuramyl-(pentapeptide) pyrophosphoryl-undecaprenol N-acetylglucosamine transferase
MQPDAKIPIALRAITRWVPGCPAIGPQGRSACGDAEPHTSHGPAGGAVLCVIGPRPLERDIVRAAGLPYARLNVGGIHGVAPHHAAPNLLRLALAVPRAAALMRRFRPDVVVLGGGYVCVPVAVAARALRIPVLTLCVDVVPGWAVRFTARLSTQVASAFPEATHLLPQARITGYPLRDEFRRADRARGRARFGVPDGATMVLAFGGSLGARAINDAVEGALEHLLAVAHVVHITGPAARRQALGDGRPTGVTPTASAMWAPPTAGLRPASSRLPPTTYCDRYHRCEYLDAAAMADALAAADLAICRAGAATMAELPVAGTPAILVPGEFSAQEGNARALAAHGAAHVIRNRDLTAERLAAETLALLADKARLATMAVACRALAHGDAAGPVAAMVREVAGHA